ncbi:HEPN domain-containing protein [Candidatus Sumerlaeota bacterium]|nr:HEPN domain-containing protein [Candidatus Sumerlaeota bacterium]
MNESHRLARVLLEKAKGDLYVVERMKDDAEAPAWTIGFHAQQAVEKALKAVLSANGVDYPHTHNLTVLLDLVVENGVGVPPGAHELPGLTPFAAGFRYDDEGSSDAIPPLDRAWAAECAARTIRWAESALDTEKA